MAEADHTKYPSERSPICLFHSDKPKLGPNPYFNFYDACWPAGLAGSPFCPKMQPSALHVSVNLLSQLRILGAAAHFDLAQLRTRRCDIAELEMSLTQISLASV